MSVNLTTDSPQHYSENYLTEQESLSPDDGRINYANRAQMHGSRHVVNMLGKITFFSTRNLLFSISCHFCLKSFKINQKICIWKNKFIEVNCFLSLQIFHLFLKKYCWFWPWFAEKYLWVCSNHKPFQICFWN